MKSIKFIRGTVGFADDTVAVALGNLPPNAYIVNIYVDVITAFNASTDDLLTIGTSGDPDRFVDDLDITDVGRKTVPVLLGSVVQSVNNPTPIQAVYTSSGDAPTTGSAVITITYAFDEN